jgi:phage portal protein BeeE
MGVLPIMVGFSDKTATYASAEQIFLAHAVHCIRPWHRRFETSIRKNLLTKQKRETGFYVKFIDTELLRGAAKDRAAYYATALGSGGSPAWMTPNEVRALEEMDAIDGGDELPAPTNLPAPPADAGASNGTP